jgi:hypothetical protein
MKNLYKTARFYYDTHDWINPSLPPLEIRGGISPPLKITPLPLASPLKIRGEKGEL